MPTLLFAVRPPSVFQRHTHTADVLYSTAGSLFRRWIRLLASSATGLDFFIFFVLRHVFTQTSVKVVSSEPISGINKPALAPQYTPSHCVQTALTLSVWLTCNACSYWMAAAQVEEKWSVGEGKGLVAQFSADRLYYLKILLDHAGVPGNWDNISQLFEY